VNKIFADAGYWIAVLNPADALHHNARTVSAKLGQFHAVTSELVLIETLNALSRTALQRSKAAKLTRRLSL
jgi:uncharacterized protein